LGYVGAYFLDSVHGGASTHFAVNKNSVFKKKAKNQNLPKNTLFFGKKL